MTCRTPPAADAPSPRNRVEELSRRYRVTTRCIRYWRAHGWPWWAERMEELREGRHPAWEGIAVHDGHLVMEDGEVIGPDELRGYIWLARQCTFEAERCATLERRVAELEARQARLQVAANGGNVFGLPDALSGSQAGSGHSGGAATVTEVTGRNRQLRGVGRSLGNQLALPGLPDRDTPP